MIFLFPFVCAYFLDRHFLFIFTYVPTLLRFVRRNGEKKGWNKLCLLYFIKFCSTNANDIYLDNTEKLSLLKAYHEKPVAPFFIWYCHMMHTIKIIYHAEEMKEGNIISREMCQKISFWNTYVYLLLYASLHVNANDLVLTWIHLKVYTNRKGRWIPHGIRENMQRGIKWRVFGTCVHIRTSGFPVKQQNVDDARYDIT